MAYAWAALFATLALISVLQLVWSSGGRSFRISLVSTIFFSIAAIAFVLRPGLANREK